MAKDTIEVTIQAPLWVWAICKFDDQGQQWRDLARYIRGQPNIVDGESVAATLEACADCVHSLMWAVRDRIVEMEKEKASKMAKWEYKTVSVHTGGPPERKLNELGAEGWELVHIIENPHYGQDGVYRTWVFKRPRQDPNVPVCVRCGNQEPDLQPRSFGEWFMCAPCRREVDK